MLKDYRKRFVTSIMLLAGLALLIVFVVIGVVSARNEWTRMKNTMEIVVSPWETPGDNFRTIDRDGRNSFEEHDNSGRLQGEQDNMPEEPPSDEAPRGMDNGNAALPGGIPPKDNRAGIRDFSSDNENISAVLYDTESGEISVLSKRETLDESALTEIVEAVSRQEKNFGTLSRYGITYYKESTETIVRMALTGSSYLSSAIAKNLLFLALAYVAMMALMLLISFKLAKTAARPMEDAVAMERQFVADISHDLKTPITVVLANSSILRSNSDSSVRDQMQWIDSTEDAAKNMMTLVSEMLELSSLESEGRTALKESVDLSSAAEKCVLQMESVAFERGVIMDSDIEEDISAEADHEFVQRIFSALIENALKYEPVGGSVQVCLKRSGKSAVFSVKNDGSVISEEDLPHIFERFYRGDKSRGEKKGYGLGLPIIKTMAELIGAEIEAKSSTEDGTVFTVRFSA